MNEKNSPAPLPSKNALAGNDSAKSNSGDGAKGAAPGGAAPVASPVSGSPARFGGHIGGGKRRSDGLIAGSEEAKAADRAKDAQRQRDNRAAKKVTASPPTLPSAAVPAPGAVSATLAHSSAVPVPVAPVAGLAPLASAPGPAFVEWSASLLTRPARLILRIIDRVRMASLTKRVAKLNLTQDARKEILTGFEWEAKATEDFTQSLAYAAQLELNKRRVGGAESSHLINVAICGGELLMAHVTALGTLEKIALEQGGGQKPAASIQN